MNEMNDTEYKLNLIIISRFSEAAMKHNLLKDNSAFHRHVNSYSTNDEYFGSYASMSTEQNEKLCSGFVDLFPDGRGRITLHKETTGKPEFVAAVEIPLTKAEKKLVKKAIKKKHENCLIMICRIKPSDQPN